MYQYGNWHTSLKIAVPVTARPAQQLRRELILPLPRHKQ
jgi:hypothetical protein